MIGCNMSTLAGRERATARERERETESERERERESEGDICVYNDLLTTF